MSLSSCRLTILSSLSRFLSFLLRMKKNNITVHDLSENKRRIPNPVLHFEDAFQDYRKFNFLQKVHLRRLKLRLILQDIMFKSKRPTKFFLWEQVLIGESHLNVNNEDPRTTVIDIILVASLLSLSRCSSTFNI